MRRHLAIILCRSTSTTINGVTYLQVSQTYSFQKIWRQIIENVYRKQKLRGNIGKKKWCAGLENLQREYLTTDSPHEFIHCYACRLLNICLLYKSYLLYQSINCSFPLPRQLISWSRKSTCWGAAVTTGSWVSYLGIPRPAERSPLVRVLPAKTAPSLLLYRWAMVWQWSDDASQSSSLQPSSPAGIRSLSITRSAEQEALNAYSAGGRFRHYWRQYHHKLVRCFR